MATTAKDIIDQASDSLHGYGSSQDRVTPLSLDISPTDLSFKVDYSFGQSVGITPGVVEIDSEQLYVTQVDAETGVCRLANGFGRGYNNTTATAHVAGSRVVSRPKFPRAGLLRRLNDVIGGVFPQLFVPHSYAGIVKSPSDSYDLGSTFGTPVSVLSAEWQDPIGNWHGCRSYSIDQADGTFRLGSGCLVGRPLRVTYTTAPRTFTSETDELVAQTGLPESCADLLSLGIVAYQVPSLDISRAQVSSVEASDRSRVVPPSAGVSAAKYVMAEFQNRLANEAQSLRRQYRPRIHRTYI